MANLRTSIDNLKEYIIVQTSYMTYALLRDPVQSAFFPRDLAGVNMMAHYPIEPRFGRGCSNHIALEILKNKHGLRGSMIVIFFDLTAGFKLNSHSPGWLLTAVCHRLTST